ncbi:expressed unknown protein [Seminavis robusta]|uniref:Uncharacterized protein n=1 Tax=Seminavis robusta TaxID=568900 RepID=A0A9N8E229_9STRA|nr:expressed unknown protein [Seminavis robusta]|eukprot:Sro466_g148770.1 n/a (114) ;mRNA; f:20667-21008
MEDVEMSNVEEAHKTSAAAQAPSAAVRSETQQRVFSRLGFDTEAKLNEATAGNSRKQRAVEKMMVAELHHVKGELAVERSALQNENDSLKRAIRELRARQQQQQQQPQAAGIH